MRTKTRREVLKMAAGSAAGLALAAAPEMLFAEAPKAVKAASALTPGSFRMLPLGEIRPSGWLQRQLRTQADGLGGHVDEFWPDLGSESGWTGGKGESWERGPYFIDGLYPLAVLLEDETLKAKAMKFINWTLDNQQPNGMIGPRSNSDWWPRMVMVKVLAQFHDATNDPRVIPVLTRYFHYQLEAMPSHPLYEWAKYRWQDEVLIVQWLYDHTHDPKLIALCTLLKQQGYDWEAAFADFPFKTGLTRAVLANKETALQAHGVNHGQAIKTAAVQYRMSGDPTERQKYFHQIGTLDRYHGMPNGMYSCDEHLSGEDPSHGTELCTVVETMFSMEVALATFGDAAIGDRIEKITFNALPGTFTDDMWAHQYDQQPNQIQVSLNSKPWSTNGPESNLFGLEPNFGCCTANFHQGWPKFAASLWMASQDDGLVAALYSPCQVKTKVRGVGVQLHEETEYPFRETVRIAVNPEKALQFPVSLRIPAWAGGASIRVNGQPVQAAVKPGDFARLDRTWAPGDVIELRLPMEPRMMRGFHRSIGIERGPIVFSLQPGSQWVKLRDRGMTADWQVFPTEPWNYALAVDEKTVAKLRVLEFPVGPRPFSTQDAPVKLQVMGRRINEWRSEDGVALPLPPSPIASNEPEQSLTLVPYAGAKLRITSFPQLKS